MTEITRELRNLTQRHHKHATKNTVQLLTLFCITLIFTVLGSCLRTLGIFSIELDKMKADPTRFTILLTLALLIICRAGVDHSISACRTAAAAAAATAVVWAGRTALPSAPLAVTAGARARCAAAPPTSAADQAAPASLRGAPLSPAGARVPG